MSGVETLDRVRLEESKEEEISGDILESKSYKSFLDIRK